MVAASTIDRKNKRRIVDPLRIWKFRIFVSMIFFLQEIRTEGLFELVKKTRFLRNLEREREREGNWKARERMREEFSEYKTLMKYDFHPRGQPLIFGSLTRLLLELFSCLKFHASFWYPFWMMGWNPSLWKLYKIETTSFHLMLQTSFKFWVWFDVKISKRFLVWKWVFRSERKEVRRRKWRMWCDVSEGRKKRKI